ncbi:MAG: sulfatase-like hydrolase/transferase [Planctomycetota bacterium]
MASTSDRPNIVLITSDQQRYDSLGCTGCAAAKTPHLDALAARGTLFRQHYVTNPVCSPSRGSFMTGLYPNESGLWANGCALPEDRPTLASTLSDAGYQTAHVGKLHLVPILDRVAPHPAYGFEHLEVGEADQMYPHDDHWNFLRRSDPLGYVDYMNELYKHGHAAGYTSALPEPLHHSTWVTDRTLNWLSDTRTDDEPFFLNVGYFDPHHAFNPIEPWASMFAEIDLPEPFHDPAVIDQRPDGYRKNYNYSRYLLQDPATLPAIVRAYHAMIAHLDHCVGRLLAGLEDHGLANNTIVVFSSDHGEMLGSHGMLHKGGFLLDDLMRVPLIVAGPGQEPAVVDQLTSMIDLMRTFTEWAGCANPSPHGRPLQSVDHRPLPEGGHDAVFAQWENHTVETADRSIRMVRTQRHKLITYAEPEVGELYDLADDPLETHNRFTDPGYVDTRAELSVMLDTRLDQARPQTPAIVGW